MHGKGCDGVWNNLGGGKRSCGIAFFACWPMPPAAAAASGVIAGAVRGVAVRCVRCSGGGVANGCGGGGACAPSGTAASVSSTTRGREDAWGSRPGNPVGRKPLGAAAGGPPPDDWPLNVARSCACAQQIRPIEDLKPADDCRARAVVASWPSGSVHRRCEAAERAAERTAAISASTCWAILAHSGRSVSPLRPTEGVCSGPRHSQPAPTRRSSEGRPGSRTT